MDPDDFLDDDFPDLPDNALQQLENDAILHSTQAAQRRTIAPALLATAATFQTVLVKQEPALDDDYGLDGDEDFDDAVINKDTLFRPPVDHSLPQRPKQSTAHFAQPHRGSEKTDAHPPFARPAPPNNRYGPPQQPNRYGPPQGTTRYGPPQPGNRYGPPSAARYGPPRSQATPPSSIVPRVGGGRGTIAPDAADGGDGAVLSMLQDRLKALEADLNSARGEVAILRSNSARTQQVHDAELVRLKKQNAEQMAKQERLVEQAVAAEKSATTELQFLRRDMKDASNRGRRKDGSFTAGGGGGGGAPATPKKTVKSLGIADGFDDMDIVASPSKGAGWAKSAAAAGMPAVERTPSKNKKKRSFVDSPVMALETETGDAAMDEVESIPAPVPIDLPRPTPRPEPTSSAVYDELEHLGPPYIMLQRLLDHSAPDSDTPTFDILSHCYLPSEPDMSLAATVYRQLPLVGNPESTLQLMVDFCLLIVDLWRRCYNDSEWAPIRHLCQLVDFVLSFNSTSIAPYIFPPLLLTAQDTLFEVANRRAQSATGDLSADVALRPLTDHVDTSQILDTMRTVMAACNAASPAALLPEIWRFVTTDTVTLLLGPKQPWKDTEVMLEILGTSALGGSLGPRGQQDEDAKATAAAIIEKISRFLLDSPLSAVTPRHRNNLKHAAILTLRAFTDSPWCAQQMAAHPLLVPRLAKVLEASVRGLNDMQTLDWKLLKVKRVWQKPGRMTWRQLQAAVSGQNGDNVPSEDDPDQTDPDEGTDDQGNKRYINLYQTLDPLGDDEPGNDILGLYRLIFQSVWLLHWLTVNPTTAPVIKTNDKLRNDSSISRGRYLYALGRLCYATDVFYERGIQSVTIERAHDLVENVATQEDIDAINALFAEGGGRGDEESVDSVEGKGKGREKAEPGPNGDKMEGVEGG